MHFVDILGFQKGFICSYNGLLGPPWGAPKVQKWVNDTYIANFGQLDHYVVFGTKFGAVQDFQRGKMCPIGIQQTPLDPPRPPPRPPKPSKKPQTIKKKTPNPLNDPPYNQFNRSSYLITHRFSQNYPKMQKSPKNAKIAQNCKNGPKMKKCKNENLPMVTPMMFTDQKLYEIPPKNYKMGQKCKNDPK